MATPTAIGALLVSVALYALIALCVAYCGLSQLVAWPICAIVGACVAAGILRDVLTLRRLRKNSFNLSVGGSLPLAAIGSANTRATPSEAPSLASAQTNNLNPNKDPRPLDQQPTLASDNPPQTKTTRREIFAAFLCFISIIGLDIAHAGPINTWMLRLSLDLVLSLLAYRALVHHDRSQKMQTAILTLIPLVALAQIIEPFLFLAILSAYSLVFWRLSRQIALMPPSTGTTALTFIDKPADDTQRRPLASWALPWLVRLVALTLVIAAIVLAFFLMPRWGGSTGAQVPNAALQGQYPPQVALDKTGDIFLDPSLIFTADLPEMPDAHYWRFEVQERFDGIRWKGIETRTRPPKTINTPKYGPYTLEFTREWRDRRVPTLAQTVELKWSNTEDQKDQLPFTHDALGIWYQGLRQPKSGIYAYEIYVDPTDLDMHQAPWAQVNTHIWPIDHKSYPRIHALAQELTANTKTNREKAEKIRRFLSQNYTYSLKRPQRNGPIVDDFLFSQKFGHCEVFSTTMAVLLASLDVPVRHVTGFMSSEYRGGLNYVRATHAHSWLEVYDEQSNRWQRYDPTPASDQPEISWIVLLNDAFMRYKSLPLYRWIVANHLVIAASLAALLSLLAFFAATRAFLGLKWPRKAALLLALALSVGPYSVFILATELGIQSLPLGLLAGLLACLALVGPWIWASFKSLEPIWVAIHHHIMIEALRRPETQQLAQKSLGELWLFDFPTELSDLKIFLQTYVAARYIPEQAHKGRAQNRPSLQLRQLLHIHLLGLKAIRALHTKVATTSDPQPPKPPKV